MSSNNNASDVSQDSHQSSSAQEVKMSGNQEQGAHSATTTTNVPEPLGLSSEELYRLGFSKLPTKEEARLELSKNYAAPIPTSTDAFNSWNGKTFPPYQKHKPTDTHHGLVESRKRSAEELNKATKKQRLQVESDSDSDSDLVQDQYGLRKQKFSATVAQGSVNEDSTSEEEDDSEPASSPSPASNSQTSSTQDMEVRSLAEAYQLVMEYKNLPSNTYTKSQYQISYKRAWDKVYNPYKQAWKSLVSPTVDAAAAQEIARNNGTAAVKALGGILKIMELAVEDDIAEAGDVGVDLSQYLTIPKHAGRKETMYIAPGYSKEAWMASVKRTHQALYRPKHLEAMKDCEDQGIPEASAKIIAQQAASQYMKDLGTQTIHTRAKADDLQKAHAANQTLGEWLASWEEKTRASRAKTAAKKRN